MKKIKLRHLQAPTPAKWVKIGIALLSVSTFISASAFAADKDIIGYVSLGLGVIGTFISNLFKTDVSD
jgi:hypothetical protein